MILLNGYEVVPTRTVAGVSTAQLVRQTKTQHAIHILHGIRPIRIPTIGGLLQMANMDSTAKISWLKTEVVGCGLEDNAGQGSQAAAKVGQMNTMTLILICGIQYLHLVLITGATRAAA